MTSIQAKKPRLEMSTDSRRRGQRLFGVLLGTLNKFKDDSEKRSEGVNIILTRAVHQ